MAPRAGPILLLVRDAAAADPVMSGLRDELDAGRLRRMTRNARHLADAGHLRPDVTVEHAAEVMWAYTAPELYELLVLRRGWTAARYGAFIADAVTAALLPPSHPSAQRARNLDPPPGCAPALHPARHSLTGNRVLGPHQRIQPRGGDE